MVSDGVNKVSDGVGMVLDGIRKMLVGVRKVYDGVRKVSCQTMQFDFRPSILYNMSVFISPTKPNQSTTANPSSRWCEDGAGLRHEELLFHSH